MSEFAFHPPDLSPSTGFPSPHEYNQQQPGSSSAAGSSYSLTVGDHHHALGGGNGVGPEAGAGGAGFTTRSPAGFEHLSNGRDEAVEQLHQRGGTAGGAEDPLPAPQQLPPHPYHPPPFGGYSFNQPHAGANIRNTRPMTAPSSVSAPYFHGAMYSPHTSAGGPSPYYPDGGPPAFHGYQQHHPSPFQYQVDSGVHQLSHDGDFQRERGFSLPELVGLGPGAPSVDGGLPDDPRYGSVDSEERDSPSSAGPFLYAPPPPPRGYYEPSSVLHDPYGGGPSSRPTTADSSRPTSSHQQRPLTGHAPPTLPPGYTSRSIRGVEAGHQAGESKVYNFVASAGQTSKRPRRRYDEIERLYDCDYPGCQKAYGTLNHLNSHKTMQKHGPKSTPAQFKELRKQWRDKKKKQAAEAARAAPNDPSNGNDPTAGLPPSMSGSGAGDRPRPSTSGGEYHYSVPAPFMTPLGNPVALYGGPPMHLAHPPPGTFLDPNATATHTGPPPHPATAFAGSSFTLPGPPHGPPSLFPSAYQAASRPVTAPNYYGAPVFGLGGMNGGGAPRLAAPLPLYPNGAGGGGGMIAPQARRMSLPSELKQPTPVFGYGAPGGEERFESIREEGEHTPLGALGGSQEELVGGAEAGSR